jgi:hypothetical protein
VAQPRGAAGDPTAAVAEEEARCKRAEVQAAGRMQGEPPGCRISRKIFLELRHHSWNKTPFSSSSVTQMYSIPGSRAMTDVAFGNGGAENRVMGSAALADDSLAHGVQNQFRDTVQV